MDPTSGSSEPAMSRHQSWCIGFLSSGNSPCDCRIPANQPRSVEPGLCFEQSPRTQGRLTMPLLCELKAGHAGAHRAGTTHWVMGRPEQLYREAYTHLIVQLAMPPEPWFTFGAHTDMPGDELEFWGQDEAGMPLWEKVKDKPLIAMVDTPGESWCVDPHCVWDSHDHTVRDGYYSD
jgi:hypothetical protein